jgi:subtilisin-like proprotein convertase family protein
MTTDNNMKTNLTKILGGVVCGLALGLTTASASIITVPSGSISTLAGTVPDGSSVGITSTINVSSQGSVLNSVILTLNMSGGNNGDLYAYLRYGGQTVALLNRPGLGLTGDTEGIGYVNSGYNNVILQNGGSNGNINSAGGSYSSSSQVTGTYYAADGTTAFNAFNGSNPNGGWVLFISDLSGGDGSNVSVLNSWSLTLDVVPEPVNVALGVFAALLLAVAGIRRWRNLRRA